MTEPRHPLGQITRDSDGVSLHFERQLSHPPERVWRALTASDQLRHWMPCDIVGPREAGAGYHICLDHLVALVETDDPPAFIDADPVPYEILYAAVNERAR